MLRLVCLFIAIFNIGIVAAATVHSAVGKSVQRGAAYRSIGYEYSPFEDKPSLHADADDSEECNYREMESQVLNIKCPDVCKPYNNLTFPSEFAECAPLAQFGCSHSECTTVDSELGFSCQLDKLRLENENIVCQGSKVLFEEIDIVRFGEVTFNIDISAPPVQTDLYFLADTTGSQNEAIATAVLKARDMVKVFGDRENVAFGVGHYEDERDLDGGFEHQLKITTDTREAIRAIRRWRTGDGQDIEEANLVALYRIAMNKDSEIGWRQGSRRFIVYFGDSPGHEPTCDSSGKAITRDVVIDALQEKGITVVAVNFGDLDAEVRSFPITGCGGATGAPSGQATDITDATGGAVVSSNDQTQLIALIKQALSLVIRKYEVISENCDPFMESRHNPALPLILRPLDKAQVKNSIKIKPNVCEEDNSFNCEYVYKESGANIQGGVQFQFPLINGC